MPILNRAFTRSAPREILDRDRFGNDDVADLLGRRANFHVVPLFLLAGAAERRERAGSAVVLVG
jgi:hypothetical protein